MSKACGLHCFDQEVHDDCPHCTRIRIAALQAEIERLKGENERARELLDEYRTQVMNQAARLAELTGLPEFGGG